ncbi:MAG TPA: DNA-binding protein WhiA, partial [Rhodoglobus sp.]|nr:DNA-binding protein WhiA [Rhodoglobus sp.]
MALTAEVKEELGAIQSGKTTVRAAELATILRFSGGLHVISGRIAVESEVESEQLAKRIRKDIAELYGVRAEITIVSASGVRRTSHYLVRVLDGGETLARQTGLLDARRRPIRGLPNRLTTGSREDLAAVWRGAFLASGSLTDPGRSAVLEVTCPGNEAAMALVGAAGRLRIAAKAREVRGIHRVVVRDGEAKAHARHAKQFGEGPHDDHVVAGARQLRGAGRAGEVDIGLIHQHDRVRRLHPTGPRLSHQA